jgi:hypothetical protein
VHALQHAHQLSIADAELAARARDPLADEKWWAVGRRRDARYLERMLELVDSDFGFGAAECDRFAPDGMAIGSDEHLRWLLHVRREAVADRRRAKGACSSLGRLCGDRLWARLDLLARAHVLLPGVLRMARAHDAAVAEAAAELQAEGGMDGA